MTTVEYQASCSGIQSDVAHSYIIMGSFASEFLFSLSFWLCASESIYPLKVLR